MYSQTRKWAATALSLFLALVCAGSLGVTTRAQPSGPFAHEIKEWEIQDFINQYSWYNSGVQPQASFQQVRMVYLVPLR